METSGVRVGTDAGISAGSRNKERSGGENKDFRTEEREDVLYNRRGL